MSDANSTKPPFSSQNRQPQVVAIFTRLLTAARQAKIDTCDRKHDFRARSYQRVVEDLSVHFTDAHPLRSVDQLRKRPGYGTKTLSRIEEILKTGTLQELQELQDLQDLQDLSVTPNTSCNNASAAADAVSTTATKRLAANRRTELHDLLSITGIGPVKANALLDQGFTREELRALHAAKTRINAAPSTTRSTSSTTRSSRRASDPPIAPPPASASPPPSRYDQARLTHHQWLGVKYDDDLRHRIPRAVIATFDSFLQQWAKTTDRDASRTLVTVCGSYRRGQPDSGDIDVLITRETWQDKENVTAGLRALLGVLRKKRWLIDDLSDPAKVHTKYMGFLRVPGHPWALRLDVRAVEHTHYASALAYFTGSKEENLRLRRAALAKKWILSEYGLVDAEGNTKVTHTEQDIYAALDLPYVAPTDR